MLILLLAPILLQSVDTIYESPALQELVYRAVAANQHLPTELVGYRAEVESEATMIILTAEDEELVGQVEQIASQLEWDREGLHEQRVIGHRVESASPNLSVITLLPEGWLFPTLYGDWLRTTTPADSVEDDERGATGYRAIHPFSDAGHEHYFYEGGDTIDIVELPERTLRIIRVHIRPRTVPTERVLLFHGEIDLDADYHQIVRLRGRLVTLQPQAGLLHRILAHTLTAAAYLEFVNAEYEGHYWLPYTQRFEAQALSGLSESRAVVRVVSKFYEHQIETGPPLADSIASEIERQEPKLTFAPRDSLASYGRWRTTPGAMTTPLSAHDFDDVGPPALRRTGPPHLSFGGRRFSDLLRYNRVEGLYTGGGATLDFRDLAPGLRLRAMAGWAWKGATPRASLDLSFEREHWKTTVGVGRELVVTNDFLPALERYPGIFTFIGAPDDFDYLDRRRLGLTTTRRLPGPSDSEIRLEVNWHDDRPEERRLTRSPISRDTLRLNRPLTPGHYLHSRLVLGFGRSQNVHSIRPGLGAQLAIERASGQLEWHRIQTALQYRNHYGPLTTAIRLDAGIVLGAEPPLQSLYEIGGGSTLPGFDYKEFAGDRAAIIRTTLRMRTGILDDPIRLGKLILPPIAPAPAIRWQLGWTTASTQTIERMVEELGSVPTRRPRHSIDLGLTFLSGTIGIGIARPLDQSAPWRFTWGAGWGI